MSPLTALPAGLIVIGLALTPTGSYSFDGTSMLAVADSLVTKGSFAVSCSVGMAGRGGQCWSIWYPLLSVAMMPFVALGRALANVTGVAPRPVEAVAALVVPVLCSAGAATLTARMALELGARVRASVLVAIGLFFGTELWTYSRTLYAEPLAAFLVILAAWGLLGSGRRRATGAAAIALAILAKPQMGLVGLGIGAGMALHDRSLRPLLWASAATAAGVLLYLLYNELRFENFLDFGGKARSFEAATGAPKSGGRPLTERALLGLGVLLVSPENGLLIYSPLAAVGAIGLAKRLRNRTALACAGGAVAVLAAYLLQPYGGSWGTRYLVPALPLLAVGLAVVRGRLARVAVVLACLTAVSQLPNLVAYYQRYYREQAPRALSEGRIEPHWDAWTPRPQIVGVWSSASHQLRDAGTTSPEALVRGSQSVSDRQENLLQTVSLWWWMLPAVGVPAWLGAGLSVAAIALGVALLVAAAGSSRPGGDGPSRLGHSPAKVPIVEASASDSG